MKQGDKDKFWENICQRRKVEEYSSSEVPDSDNNSIKESVEFSEPSFRMNFAESLLEVASETEFPTSRWKLLQDRTSLQSQFRTQREPSERRERDEFLVLVCLI